MSSLPSGARWSCSLCSAAADVGCSAAAAAADAAACSGAAGYCCYCHVPPQAAAPICALVLMLMCGVGLLSTKY